MRFPRMGGIGLIIPTGKACKIGFRKMNENGVSKMRNNTSEMLNFGVRPVMSFYMRIACAKLSRSST